MSSRPKAAARRRSGETPVFRFCLSFCRPKSLTGVPFMRSHRMGVVVGVGVSVVVFAVAVAVASFCCHRDPEPVEGEGPPKKQTQQQDLEPFSPRDFRRCLCLLKLSSSTSPQIFFPESTPKTPANSHVKPPNHLTHYQSTTSTWRISSTQLAILDIELKIAVKSGRQPKARP